MSPNNLHPISERQHAANRANAVTHGICNISPVLTCENSVEFHAYYDLLHVEFAPRSANEQDLFDQIVRTRWQQRRLQAIEQIHLEIELAKPDIRNGYDFLEAQGLTAVAYQKLAGHTQILHLLNRQLSRLSRHHHRLLHLYLDLHGPLNDAPPPPIEPAETEPVPSPSPETVKNKPIPISGQLAPAAGYFHQKPAPTEPAEPVPHWTTRVFRRQQLTHTATTRPTS